ncbi:MAG: SDR family oxidoreductase [Actinomycetota bacterium]
MSDGVTMEKNAGRVVVVSGAAQGIGAAAVRWFAEREGARVVATDIANESEELKAISGDVRFHRCDVSVEADVVELARWTREQFGSVDVLVNNAGVVLVKPLVETTWEDYRRVVDINVGGTMLMCREFIPLLAEARAPAIVNVASVSGHVGQVNHAVYGATKGALLSFTRALAWELAPSGIRVNSLSPGSVDTPMLRSDVEGEALRHGVSVPEMRKEREGEQAFGRWADPAEIAAAIGFLAGDGASFVTGSDLLADCGWTAR